MNNSTKNNKDGQQLFNNFISEQYTHYLDDIIHFNTKHQTDLEIIHDEILINHPHYNPCDINSCLATNRHCTTYYQEGPEGKEPETSGLSAFYIKTWDALHYQLNHLWQTGLRHRTVQNKMNNRNDDELDSTDDKMNEQSKIINRNRVELGRLFGRFGTEHNGYDL